MAASSYWRNTTKFVTTSTRCQPKDCQIYSGSCRIWRKTWHSLRNSYKGTTSPLWWLVSVIRSLPVHKSCSTWQPEASFTLKFQAEYKQELSYKYNLKWIKVYLINQLIRGLSEKCRKEIAVSLFIHKKISNLCLKIYVRHRFKVFLSLN